MTSEAKTITYARPVDAWGEGAPAPFPAMLCFWKNRAADPASKRNPAGRAAEPVPSPAAPDPEELAKRPPTPRGGGPNGQECPGPTPRGEQGVAARLAIMWPGITMGVWLPSAS